MRCHLGSWYKIEVYGTEKSQAYRAPVADFPGLHGFIAVKTVEYNIWSERVLCGALGLFRFEKCLSNL